MTMKLEIISIHIKNSPQAMPLAAAMLKVGLESDLQLKDQLIINCPEFYLGDEAEEIFSYLEESSPELVALSIYLWNRELSLQVASLIKERMAGTLLFAGGAEASAAPETLLETGLFDFVICGEGEEVTTAAMKLLVGNELTAVKQHLAKLPGLYLQGLEKAAAETAWPVADLNSLPSPYLLGTINPRKYEGLLWELSRGCPFKCAFCYESRGIAGVRQFSLERIRRELTLFEENLVDQVFVLDPTFNRDRERAKKILAMIAEIAPTIHFTFEVRTEFIDQEMAELFGAINCGLQIGLQSARPEVLRQVNRMIEPESYREQINLLNLAGVTFGLDLIYGLPGDNPEGFKESLDYALSLQPNNLDIFPLAVLPGTALAERAEELGLNHLSEAPYSIISTPGFSGNDLAAAERLSEATNIFYNRGGAVSWLFMLLETLEIRGSHLMEEFAHWLESRYPAGKWSELPENPITLQKEFLESFLALHGRSELYPALCDLISYHSACSCSLYAGPAGEAPGIEYSGSTIFSPAPGTIEFTLNYELEALLALGEINLEELISHYPQEPNKSAVYNFRGEIRPLMLEESWHNLLFTFDGKTPLEALLSTQGPYDEEELAEFIDFALSEQIIVIVGAR